MCNLILYGEERCRLVGTKRINDLEMRKMEDEIIFNIDVILAKRKSMKIYIDK